MFIVPMLMIAGALGDVGFSDTQNYSPVLKTEISDEMRFIRFSLIGSEKAFRTKELARTIQSAGFDQLRESELLYMLDRGFMSSRTSQEFLSDLSAVLAQYPFAVDPFERERMNVVEGLPEFRVEGYWRNDMDQATGSYPTPQAHENAWPQKVAFLAKLGQVEAALKDAECFMNYRGLSLSRLEEDTYVGSCEFIDTAAKVVWPCGYAQHYVDKHNVVPSADFYDYIMDFDVSQITSCKKSDEL